MSTYPGFGEEPSDVSATTAYDAFDTAVQAQLDSEATSPASRNAVTVRLARDTLGHNADDTRRHDAETAVLLKRLDDERAREMERLDNAERFYRERLAELSVERISAVKRADDAAVSIRAERARSRGELLREKEMFEALLASAAKQIGEV